MKVLTAYDHTECSKAALDDPRNAGRHDGANKATEEGETSREGAVHKEKGRFDLESGPISARELSRSRDSPVVPSHDELTPLVPLVKVAWAEGRITRRERELIFMAAEKMGIAAGSPSHDRLSGWLEFHPTDDFYFHSLNRLNSYWANLPDDEKSLRRLDLYRTASISPKPLGAPEGTPPAAGEFAMRSWSPSKGSQKK